MAQLDVRARLEEVARLDLSDGSDDFDENALRQQNNRFLQGLGEKDPALKRNFLLRLRAILKARPQAKITQDAQDDFEFMDLEKLYQWLQQRDSMVQADGTVRFPTAEAEARTSLGELTQDDEIQFEATPETLAKMGITAKGPFTAVRLKEGTKKGTFVVSVNFQTTGEDGKPKTTSIPYKVLVFNGDRIIDSLSKDMGDQPDQSAKQPKEAPSDFEAFLMVKIPTFSLPTARALFHTHQPNYEKIFKAEYPELLVQNGISLTKHFVYFIQWAQENRVPLNDDSIRVFLDALSGRHQKDQVDDQPETQADKIVQKAEGSLRGEKDQDEHVLSYQDGRRRANAEATEIAIKNHGPLFAIIRQAGSFFDPYTYNRLTGNYSAKVNAVAAGGNEYLSIEDITPYLNNPATPGHIKERITPSNFAGRLNSTTIYNKSGDAQLREALAFSAKTIERKNVSPENFRVQYDDSGAITGVFINESGSGESTPYDPSTFITSPDALRNLPNNTTTIEFGGISRDIDLQSYFARYRTLEAQNSNRSQQIVLYDEKEQRVTQSRNPGWFVEGRDEFYSRIAEEITRGGNTDVEKILMIGNFLQTKLSYIKELAEVNKLTLGTFMDGGGDCEDSYTAFKTLANSIGLGKLVGGVLFHEHVAAMIKGSHGGATYKINGETWTIMETATNGRAATPGQTDHFNPKAFILPNGQVIAAEGSGLTVLQLTTEDQLDQALVQNFDAQRLAVERFIADPKNQPKEENFREKENIGDELTPFTEALINAYGDIAKTGLVAQSVTERFSEALKKGAELLQKWADFAQKKEEAARAKQVAGEPKLAGEAGQRYLEARRHFLLNVEPTFGKLQTILQGCVGKENSKAAMIDCNDRMVAVIDESEVSIDFEKMKDEFHETLKHDTKVKTSVEKDLELIVKILNELIYGPLNAILEIINQHEGRR